MITMVQVGKLVKPVDCESADCEFESRSAPQIFCPDGGIGRRAGLKNLCQYDMRVRSPLGAPKHSRLTSIECVGLMNHIHVIY